MIRRTLRKLEALAYCVLVARDEGQTNVEYSITSTSSAVFVGADTPIGPVYLGYGVATGGNRSAYLFLGRP